MKKIIVFDVDGVITDSGTNKEEIIKGILKKYGLFHLPGVEEIFGIGLNRILLLDRIYEIKEFDKEKVLNEINRELSIQESQNQLIATTFDFIQKFHGEYIFYTNTSLPKSSLLHIFESLDISKYFMELRAYDNGSKRENINYIIKKHNINPTNLLFIDDKMSHIDATKSTGIRTLLFMQDGVSLEQKIKDAFLS